MDALLVTGGELELTPDPPWRWMAGPVKLVVNGTHTIRIEGKSVVWEPDIVAAAVQAIGQPYVAPGFDAPGAVVSVVLSINPGTLSAAITNTRLAVATFGTTGTFIATMAPATNPATGVPDPVIAKTGTWKVASANQSSARSGNPAAAGGDGDDEEGASGVAGGANESEGEGEGNVHFVAFEVEDTDGNKLAGGKALVDTPDGKRHLKTLTPNGAARIDGIVPEGLTRVTITKADFLPPVVGPNGTFLAVQVVDESGKPISGAEVKFELPSGEQVIKATSPGGAARVDGLDQPGTGRVFLSRLARDGASDSEGDGSQGENGEEAGDGTSGGDGGGNGDGADDTQTSFFRCAELPGSLFEFGNSFVMPEALEILARIAQDLAGDETRKGLIFGHTDRSGTQALNKELSERRARAVFSIFTHDSDAWEEMTRGQEGTTNWFEVWGTREVKIMLNSLRCPDDTGTPLVVNKTADHLLTQAIRRFKRGDYADKPAEQEELPDSGMNDAPFRKQLFLAYAKQVTRLPIAPERFTRVDDSPFMGCGEFNPFSAEAKDEASRRSVIFVYDLPREPKDLPCKLRDIKPCLEILKAEPDVPDETNSRAHFRCPVYRDLSLECPNTRPGPAIEQDLILRFPHTLEETNDRKEVLVLESEDGTFKQEKKLATEGRAHEDGYVEMYFQDLPSRHAYRLRCEGVDEPYEVFGFTEFEDLGSVDDVSADEQFEPNAFDPEATDPVFAEADGEPTDDEESNEAIA